MSPWGLFWLALAALTFPWLLMPRRRPSEIRGILRFIWRINAFYCSFWHRLEVVGPDTLPAEGPAILISNHTCCIDHMLLQAGTRRLLGFLIAKELYDYWLFTPFCRIGRCIPVRRDGNDVAATRTALRALAEGRVVPLFPEGKILPKSGRELGPAKPGAAFIAARARVPVIPAYVWGTPETNKVVPSYLTPSRARVVFGPPVDLSDLWADGRPGREAFDEVTRRLMDAIRALKDRVEGGRAGVESRPEVAGHAPRVGPRTDRRAEPLPVGRSAARSA